MPTACQFIETGTVLGHSSLISQLTVESATILFTVQLGLFLGAFGWLKGKFKKLK